MLVASAALAGGASGDTTPRDVYACHLDGRSTTWTYVGGFPSQGKYRFAGEARCAHLDANASSDGTNDTGARLTGTFELAGEHSQLLGLPACIMQLDGFHINPVDYGRITLAGDGEGPLVFRHEMEVAAGQGDFEFHDDGDTANGVIDGYGTVSLLPTDAVEESPDTQAGCVNKDAPGFFIKGDVVAGVFRVGPDQAPSNTAPPTISGTAREGEALTAHNGTWSGSEPIVYEYQWRRCDPAGNGCEDITGAKGDRYVVQRADVGSTIRVSVTGTNAVGSSPRATSAPTAKVEPKFTRPSNTSRPTISGAARTGEILTANKGVWSGSEPIVYEYQWLRCDQAGANCLEIEGAKAERYHVQYPTDLGKRLRVRVVASNAGGSSDPAESDPTATVEYYARPANTAPPAISGIAREGEVLTAYKGSWSGSEPIAYDYQWRRCDQVGANCPDIDGAKADRYVLSAQDVNARIRVRVVATNVAGSGGPADSDPTATVQPMALPSNTSPPTISGTASVGEVLVAHEGTWSGSRPMAFEYQWQRCGQTGTDCSNIPGAKSDRYLVQFPIDLGTRIRVKVTARNSLGATPADSTATPTVGFFAPPSNTSPPKISGIAKIGEPLIADKGTWTGTAPIAYDLHWQRCDQNGANCADIPGGRSDRYVLSSLDAGSRIRLTVAATNLGGGNQASSAPTDAVEGLPRPANTAPPTISGTPRAGEILSANRGSWSGAEPLAYDYQWRRCNAAGEACADIPGAKGERYVLGSDDVGSTIRVLVTATNGSDSSSATSGPTAAVQGSAAPSNTASPTISGEPREREVLTADRGTWFGSEPIAYDYQWRRCDQAGTSCSDIPGAKGDRYPVRSDDVGHTIRVAVTATNALGSAQSTSQPTAPVGPAELCPERALDGAGASDVTVAPLCTLPATGPIYHATQYEGNPAAGGAKLAEEWAQLGTYNARREDFEQVTTRGVVPCAASPFTGCGEVRYRTRAGETNPTAPDDFAVTRGTSADDPRLDTVADIQGPSSVELGTPAETGPLGSALEPWQTPPVGAGPSYALYEERSEQWVDGEPLEVVERLWIDPKTELPLRQSRTVGEQLEAQSFYTYDPVLLDPATAPPDLFAARPPAKIDNQSVEDLALQAPLPDLAGLTALPTDADLFRQALRFREEFGLSTDPALIASTLNDPSLEPSIDEWSVPLTAAEQDEMAIRDEVLAALPSIDAYAAQNAPTSYAGVWIDQKAGGIAKAGFTDNVAAHTAAIKSLFPYPDRIEGLQATLTEAQLNALQDRIWADLDRLTSQGIDVREVALNIAQNSVDVGLPVPNPVDEQRLRDLYGQNVRVIQSAPVPSAKKKKKKKQQKPPPQHSSPARGGSRAQSSRVERNSRTERNARVEWNIPPLHGGLHITSGKDACTSGFSVAQGQGSQRTYSVLTAGHCGKPGSEWRHKGKPFGRMVRNLKARETNADAATIKVSPAMRSTHVLLGAGHFRRIDGYATVAEQHQGMPVCLAGATREPYRCGALRSPRVNVRLTDGTRLEGQGKVGGTGAEPADSGGPVFSHHGHDALGIQAATNRQTTNPGDSADYFSQIQTTLNRLGAQLVVSQNVPAFGYNDDWFKWAPTDPAAPDHATYTKAFAAGVTTNRFVVPWSAVQTTLIGNICLPLRNPATGQVDWPDDREQAYERMVRKGVRPVIVLADAPACYTQQPQTKCTPSPNATPPDDTNQANDDWYKFVAAAAERFPKAKGFEIWNEPNLPGFWGGCSTNEPDDPKRYAELLGIAYRAVKSVLSDKPDGRVVMPVVSAGLSPAGAPWETYLRRVFEAGGAAHADAIGLHPYRRATDVGNQDPNKNLDFAQSALSQLRAARARRAEFPGSGPIWVTEVGVSTASNKPHKRVDPPTLAEQAKQLTKTYRALRDAGVLVLTIHRFVDLNFDSGDDPTWERNVGVLDANFNNKRAYCDLASERGYAPCP